MDPVGAEFVHTVAEAMKLSYADREAYYGDPDFTDVPMATLLSPGYTAERRRLIGAAANNDWRPGSPEGRTPQTDYPAALRRARKAKVQITLKPKSGPTRKVTLALRTKR